jgi:tryptophanyl-tRNA synthetase
MKARYVADVFTGIRPTGGLTVANYLGAVHPLVNLQNEGRSPIVFVADLHALTDNEPGIARSHTRGVVADYLALGVDPEKTKIFIQSDIRDEISLLTLVLARLMSVTELVRVPTLKDKIKENADPESANALLLLYPVMMAADILMQRAHYIPVGEDQVAHIEITRKLARKFNNQYREVFPEPEVEVVETLRILSLKGDGKMSKSYPEGAIFLTDAAKDAVKKIKKAQTAFEGDMSPHLESHIIVAKGLTEDMSVHAQIDEIIASHLQGNAVMGAFKALLADIASEFLLRFQERRAEITSDPSYIDGILEEGRDVAKRNAQDTMNLVMEALYT